MDIKFKNNDNSNNNLNDLENKPKFKKTFFLVFVLTISILSTSLASMLDNSHSANDDFVNSSYYIDDEMTRYAKNLQRFYIYFEDFNPDVAYDKIKSLRNSLYTFENESVPSETTEITTENNFENSSENAVDNVNNNTSENQDIASNIQYTPRIIINDNSTDNYDDYYYTYQEDRSFSFLDDTDNNIITPSIYLSLATTTMSYTEKTQYIQNLSELLSNYQEVKNYLDTNDDFIYSISRKGIVLYTNSKDFENVDYLEKIDSNSELFKNTIFNGESLASSFNKNNLKCEIKIPSSIIDNPASTISNEISTNKEINSLAKNLKIISYSLFLLSLVLIVILFKFFNSELYICNNKIYSYFLKLPLIIKLIFALFSINTFIVRNNNFISDMYYSDYLYLIKYIIYFSIAIIVLLFFVQFVFSILKSPKNLKNEYEIKYIIKILNSIPILFDTRNYFLFFILLFISLAVIGATALYIFFFLYILNDEFAFVFIITILYSIGLYIALKLINIIISYAKISDYLQKFANGNIIDIPVDDTSSSKQLLELNSIKQNMQKNLEETLKSERLKTELITNVSHDLKTPLTSIINYVELLKGLSLNNKTATEYISVIDVKSQRLKMLIEDLFEAAKLSTGQMKLEMTEINLSDLLNQSIGELDTKIKSKDMKFIISTPDEPVITTVDSQKIWRVFDNLINNIIKYSPTSSRAFIDLETTDDEIKITFKNTSAYELNFNVNELFERFKRGDASRSTEGSGLGLSIAKNIIELHNGKTEIILDGDLFKVIITLPKNQSEL